MWHELSELLLGLVGAVVALGAIYLFIVNAQQDPVGGDGEPQVRRHELLTPGDDEAPSAPARHFAREAKPSVAALYICPEAGAVMQQMSAVEAVAGKGLEGDRYLLNRGYWSESDECEVTLIAQEDLDQAMRETGISLREGRHRRNIVTRNISLDFLIGRRFRIGGAYFSGARPRPPCLYLQKITEPGMARALVGRGGIGVHCFRGGPVRDGDSIVILDLSPRALLRRRWQSWRAKDDRTNE